MRRLASPARASWRHYLDPHGRLQVFEVPDGSRVFVLRWLFARAVVRAVRLGRASKRLRSVFLRGLVRAMSVPASRRVVACIFSMGAVPMARPMATTHERLRLPRRQMSTVPVFIVEVFALASIGVGFGLLVADVVMVSYVMASKQIAVSKVVLFVASGGGGSQARPKVLPDW